MKQLLQFILKVLARHTLKIYEPVVVAVTGNVGKTSTKEAIAAALKYSNATVRTSQGNLNNEFGLPLTVLGDWAGEYYNRGPSALFWLKVILTGVLKICIPRNYPDVLVLEYGADRPGDIGKLARLYPPHVAVVTGIGEIPVHVEFFASPKELADEKAKLLTGLSDKGAAVLNFDDLTVLEMKDKTKAAVTTFGFGAGATIRIHDLEFLTGGSSWGTRFKLLAGGRDYLLNVSGTLSRPQALASAAALAVATELEVDAPAALRGLSEYKPPAGRMRVIKGIKNSVIIDDTYNASPMAMHSALDTLRELPAPRRVAVLGDMLELGKYSYEAHQAIGMRIGDIADVLVCVGEKGKVIADAAANQMQPGKIFTFHTSDEAKAKVQELIQENDLILVKGSQGKRMEKVVKEIMAEPGKAGELLVRQSAKWLES